MKYRKINLQRFEEGENAGNGGGGQAGSTGTTYSYEQAEQIAEARANRAERSALANYFRSQGMTEDEITTAINDFKAKREANKPDIAAIESERDTYKTQLEQIQNENILVKRGVRSEDLDYVAFKVSQLVTDKKDFKTAADEFLKSNPRFIGGGYRVSSGVSSGSSSSGTESKNEHINNMIRSAFGR